jgi:hypothetical protein
MNNLWMATVLLALVCPQAAAQEEETSEATKKGALERVEKPVTDNEPAGDAKSTTKATESEGESSPDDSSNGENANDAEAKPEKSDAKSQGDSQDDEGTIFPHGKSWDNGVYGGSGWWASVYVGGGISILQVNEGIALTGNQMVQGFSIGSTLHAGHRWALTSDLSYSSVSLTQENLIAGWSEYSVSNLLVTLGAKVYPWAHEFCSVAIGAHVGLNQYDSTVVGDSGNGSWGGPELAAGGTIEFSYFPMHAIEIAANIRLDALLGGDNQAEMEWQGNGAPGDVRMIMGFNLLAGLHF